MVCLTILYSLNVHAVLVLLMMSLVQSTSCSRVYHVIPDDHYSTSDNTYTLKHYLNNTSKYFTSNVQLHFLPGQYFLNTDLIISNISNFSLVGNISDGEVHTVINCTSPAGVFVEKSTSILISNIAMWECSNHYTLPRITVNKRNTLLISHCFAVRVFHFSVYSRFQIKNCYIQILHEHWKLCAKSCHIKLP